MSADAIRAVTLGIRELLRTQMSGGRSVTLLPPGEDPPRGSGVNLYLYRVAQSPHTRDAPFAEGQSSNGHGTSLWLELFYLLTPFGPKPEVNDVDDEAHRALGEAMLTLHEHPILNRVHVPGFDADTILPAALHDAQADVIVRFHPVSLDELARIWSTIGKPYRLSAAYEVTLVRLLRPRPSVAAAGPIRSTELAVQTLDPPRVRTVTPREGAVATLAGNRPAPSTVTLEGFGLTRRERPPRVVVAGIVAELGATTEQTIEVLLPLELPAGPDVDLRVILDGLSSAPASFRVSPWVASTSPVRTALDPARPQDRALTILGAGLTGTTELRGDLAGAPSFTVAPAAGGTDSELGVNLPAGAPSNSAPGTDLPNGVYELRIAMPDARLSNSRRLEVIPLVAPAGNTPQSSVYDPAGPTLTVRGSRLDGTAVTVLVGGEQHVVGANAAGDFVALALGRALAKGKHSVSVVVDGHASRSIEVVAP